MDFSGKVVIVTGGAAGIGAGIVHCFAERGASIVIVDIDREYGERICQQLNLNGTVAMFIEANMTSETNIRFVVQETIDTFGQIDVLVNNVGLHFGKEIMQVSLDYFDMAIATNFRGHFLMSREVIPYMKKAQQGVIINVSSVHAMRSSALCSVYSGTKGAITAMTRSMAVELGPSQIRVNNVLPGYSINKAMEIKLAAMSEFERIEWLDKAAANIPLRKMIEPKDIGWACVFLASDQAKNITGIDLPIDGGDVAQL